MVGHYFCLLKPLWYKWQVIDISFNQYYISQSLTQFALSIQRRCLVRYNMHLVKMLWWLLVMLLSDKLRWFGNSSFVDSLPSPITPDYGGPKVCYADGVFDSRFPRFITVMEGASLFFIFLSPLSLLIILVEMRLFDFLVVFPRVPKYNFIFLAYLARSTFEYDKFNYHNCSSHPRRCWYTRYERRACDPWTSDGVISILFYSLCMYMCWQIHCFWACRDHILCCVSLT